MNFNIIFLQSSAIGPGMINLIFFALIFAVFYFFMIRPQAKKQNAQQSFQDELEKGDEVVTGSGLLGKVNKIDGNVITLEVGTKTFVRVTKNSISKEMTDALYAVESTKK